ncbi:MAG: fold metallo-hydrolase [Solirubrobacterales bacterium]|nr:fold metallo-hydrolase [Solirubrobacterales bacterium]
MIFRQITHDDLGCASYLVGDEHAGVAAVVDPKFDIDEYLRLARYFGVAIEHILETHNHADHVSGHGRLAAATGAVIHVHRLAEPEYEHEAFDDGWELRLGEVKVRALHTPGHRPEHTAFLLFDGSRDAERPWAVLTGDTLFVGDVARPDLAVDKEEGARGIFRSLQTKLLSLPGDVEVWPGHLGGSMCGGPGMDMKISSTIGYERAENISLRIAEEGAFVDDALSRLGPQPPNFHAIVAINRGPLRRAGVEGHPLTPRQVEALRTEGALVVDVRTDLQFDEAHLPGSVCITALRAGFGTRLAWLADRERDVVLIGRDDEDARHAVELAQSVGITRVGGFLAGGMTSWREERRPVLRIARMTLQELHDRWTTEGDIQILDVREKTEWDAGHIPGSTFCAYHDVRELPEGLDASRAVAVICGSGQRAATGASLIQRAGAQHAVHVVDGGVPGWGRQGWPITRGSARQTPSSRERFAAYTRADDQRPSGRSGGARQRA